MGGLARESLGGGRKRKLVSRRTNGYVLVGGSGVVGAVAGRLGGAEEIGGLGAEWRRGWDRRRWDGRRNFSATHALCNSPFTSTDQLLYLRAFLFKVQ